MSNAVNETTNQVASIASCVTGVVKLQLRNEFPFMKLAAADSTMAACLQAIEDGVQKQ